MSRETTAEHAVYEELAAGHALGALEPEDEQLFLLHLASCARCERELDVHTGTAASLAYAAGPAELPEGLFARIREAVVAESGEDAFRAREVEPPLPAPVRLADRRRGTRLAALVSAAAAAVLAVGLVGTTVLRQEPAQQLAWGERADRAVAAIDEPGRRVTLLDERNDVAAVAVLHDDAVSLVVDGMAPNEADDSLYVLWEVTRFGGKHAVGTFDIDGDGPEVLRDLDLEGRSDDVAAFALTREEGDTAPPAPQTAPLAVGEVDQA